MNARVAAWLAWLLCSLSVALLALSLLLTARTAPERLPGLATNALLGVLFPVMGALVASRRPDNPIGWLMCANPVLGIFAGVGKMYAEDALVTEPGRLP